MKKLKRILIGMMCLVLLTVGFSGCISPSGGQTKNPSEPTIGVDLNNNVHIVWMWMADSSIWYTKISPDGKMLVHGKMLFPKLTGGDPRTVIDSGGDIYLFLSGRDSAFHYTKLDNNGNVLINNSFITYRPTYSKDFDISSRMWDVLIDKNDNIHMLYLEENSTGNYSCHYVKMNTQGEILANLAIENFFGDEPITLCLGTLTIYHFYLSSAIDSKNVLHILWNKGCNTLNSTNYTSGNVNKTLYGDAIKVDSKDNLYIRSSNNYTKIDKNGTVLLFDSLSNVSVIPGYPAVEDDEGNYIYLGDNGCVDSDNNIHIVWHGVETRWRGKTLTTSEGPVDYYTVYYSKLDGNGNIIIEKKVIDADEKPGETMFTTLFLITIGIIIIVGTAITIILLVKHRKHKKQEG